MALKFYTSVAKGLKLKAKKFYGLAPTLVEVTGEKLVQEAFLPLRPSWIGLRDSCINVRIPKYGSCVSRKGIGSRFPHIRSQVPGKGSQVEGPKSRVPLFWYVNMYYISKHTGWEKKNVFVMFALQLQFTW